MNRLALDAASSLPWLLQRVFFPPFPIFAVFLLSSSLPIPNPVPITGLSGQEERGIRGCASACHIRWRLFIHLKNAPPLPVLSLGGSWRVARDNHSLIFYLFLLNKASCSLQADFVQLPPSCAPYSANREWWSLEQSPGPTADPTEDPFPRENGGLGVGTAPLNVAVGQEGPQAAAKQL